jgi:RNA polymerase sigma-70 factor (ECF subfamily)
MPSQRQLDRLFASFCRSGDPRALGRVFDATAAELLHLAIWLSGNRADGEDLLQRTFVRAIELREQFEIGRPVMPWLVGLLGNLGKHLQRDRQQRPLPRPGAAVPDPGAVAADAEFARAVTERVAAIEAPYREVLELHLQSGLNAKEIAERLGRPAGTVRTQLMRALELLRRRLPAGFVAGLAPGVTSATTLGKVKAVVVARALQDVPVATAAVGTGIVAAKYVWLAAGLLCAVAGAVILARPATPMPVGDRVVGAARASTGREVDGPSLDGKPDGRGRALERQAVSVPFDEAAPRLAPASLRLELVWRGTRDPASPIGVTMRSHDREPPSQFEAVSDSAGVCTFKDLAPGRWSIVPTHARGETLVDLHPAAAMTLPLDVDRNRDISGMVVDLNGAPVPDADIWLTGTGGERHVLVRSDADGAFNVPVSDGQQFGARKRGYAPSRARRVQRDGEAQLVLTLRGVGAALQGTVRSERGTALARARVSVVPATSRPAPRETEVGETVIAGDDGTFRLDSLLPVSSRITILGSDLAPYQETLDLVGGRTAVLDVVLLEGATLRGQVRDSKGDAVANASIFQLPLGLPGPTIHSDEMGRFELSRLSPGTRTFIISHPFGQASSSVVLVNGAVTEWNPVLSPRSVHVTGIVLGPDGAPVAGMEVGYRFPGLPETAVPRLSIPYPNIRTGVDGRFSLPEANEGLPTVHVGRQEVCVTAEEQDLVIRLTAEEVAKCIVRGRVVDEQGAPVAATVTLERHSRWPAPSAETKSDGSFEIASVPGGNYLPSVRGRDGRIAALPELTLRDGATTDLGNVVMRRPGWVNVTILDAAGRPAGAVVTFQTVEGLRVDCDDVVGSMRCGPSQPRHLFIEAHSSSDLRAVAEIDVFADATAAVELRLAPTANAMMQFVAARPRFDLGVTAIARSDDGRFAALVATSDARLSAPIWLPLGHYALDCRVSDGRHVAAEITLRSVDEFPTFEIALPLK